jgi:hypothetical protein
MQRRHCDDRRTMKCPTWPPQSEETLGRRQSSGWGRRSLWAGSNRPSQRVSWRKAFLTWSWCTSQHRESTRVWTVVGFTTGLKVSSKSTSGLWVNPRRTQRALYLSREPSAISLCLIHWSVTTLTPGGRGTSSHVLLDNSASYTSSTAHRQWGSVSSLRAEVRTGDNVGEVATDSCRQSTSLVIPAARRVTIGYVPWGSRASWAGWWTGGSTRELSGAGATCRRWETCGGSTEREVMRGADEGAGTGLGAGYHRW